ncbi:MAG: type I phosphomannose isomerase catalytic subunit [Myxococcota bacterium]
MRPLRPRPHLTRPIWAGDRLARELGKGDGPGDRVGESWEVWRDNLVDGGARLGDLAELPILVKLLDVRERLSVQVHPDDAAARRLEGAPHGKSEGWVVLRAEPGAKVAYGLSRELSAEELADRARSGAIEDDLAWMPVVPGDVIDVPAGTIHAIGGGILLYEVQQPCDLTYRLYDWGRPRPLQLDKAVAVARRSPMPAPRNPDGDLLFDTAHFRLERVRLGGVRETPWCALTVVEGRAEVAGVEVVVGSTVVLPPGRWELAGEGVALVASAGSNRRGT